MVVRINTGKSITGILRYNELKREAGQATLLQVSGMLPGAEFLNVFQLARQFKSITQLNTRTYTNAIHISLNFSPKDVLDEQKLEKIAHDYMTGIGFTDQPYLVYEHRDAGHPHVHIVTTNIDRKGKRIETHNLGKTKSEETRKALEITYGLVKAENQNYIGPDLKSMLQVNYGKQPTKSGLNAVITHVLNSYSFASLAEFNAVLGLFQVNAYRGERDSIRYSRKGLVYHFLDSKGKRIGVPMKASSFYSKPTLKRLERRYARALVRKKSHKVEVFNTVENVLDIQKGKGDSGLESFKKGLRKEGISICLINNNSGRLYGVIYVDHRSGCVFKGSDLGKQFAANGLVARFGLETAAEQNRVRSTRPLQSPVDGSANKVENSYAMAKGVRETMMEIGTQVFEILSGDISDSPFQGPVYPKDKRKKKKGKSGKDSS